VKKLGLNYPEKIGEPVSLAPA